MLTNLVHDQARLDLVCPLRQHDQRDEHWQHGDLVVFDARDLTVEHFESSVRLGEIFIEQAETRKDPTVSVETHLVFADELAEVVAHNLAGESVQMQRRLFLQHVGVFDRHFDFGFVVVVLLIQVVHFLSEAQTGRIPHF